MVTTSFTAVSEPARLAELHEQTMPQKDNLCGAFWISLALRAAGIEEVDGEPLDQDLVALRAGTLLPEGDPSTWLPPATAPRADYRLPIRAAAHPGTAGTAAPPLARLVERVSGGALVTIPVAGPWRTDAVTALLDETASVAGTTLVANVRTGPFWGTRPPAALLVAYLAGADVEGPAAEWDVGHFVTFAGAIRSAQRALVLVRDTYPSLGWGGYHLQPAEAAAAALARGDGHEGGVLCLCPAADADGLRARLAESFDIRHWDNGTPDPEEETERR